MSRQDIQVGLGGADESSELTLVLALNILDNEDGGGLLVDNRTETGLALHDDVGDTHLAGKSRQEDNELNRVDIVSDNDEGSLLGLDEGNSVVQAVLDEERLLRLLLYKSEQSPSTIEKPTDLGRSLLLLGSGLSLSLKTSLLLLPSLRTVLVEELEQLGSGVLVEGVGELSDGGGNLQTLVQDNLLALKADIFGPLDEASQVGGGLNVLAWMHDKGPST